MAYHIKECECTVYIFTHRGKKIGEPYCLIYKGVSSPLYECVCTVCMFCIVFMLVHLVRLLLYLH